MREALPRSQPQAARLALDELAPAAQGRGAALVPALAAAGIAPGAEAR
jgi:hypothetical protein